MTTKERDAVSDAPPTSRRHAAPIASDPNRSDRQSPVDMPRPPDEQRHQAAEHPDDTPPGRLDEPELLIEVYRLVHPEVQRAREKHGKVPGTGTAAWWSADDPSKIAGLLLLSEAWLIRDEQIERVVAERLKAAAGAVSEGHDWTAAAEQPSHVQLVARRAEPGPQTPSFDPVAAARWVETGSSAEGAA